MKCTMLAVLAICCFVFWSRCGYRLSSTTVVLINRLFFVFVFFCSFFVGGWGGWHFTMLRVCVCPLRPAHFVRSSVFFYGGGGGGEGYCPHALKGHYFNKL